MKKYRKIISLKTLIVFLVLSITSCEFESKVYNVISTDIFPKTEADVERLVAGNAYYVFSSAGINNIGTSPMTISAMVSDNFACTWSNWDFVFNSHEANSDLLSASNRSMYYYNRYISIMLLTIDRIKDVKMNENLKQRYIAELKCGIGYLGFTLYDLYGPIPLPTLEILKNPSEEKILPRATEQEMYDFIETNLKEAAEILPYKYDLSEYGRFTKGMANTLLLKLYMYAREWDKAEDIGRELTSSEYGYKLVPDYHSLFTLAGEINTETIYACIHFHGQNEGKYLASVLPADYPTPASQSFVKWGGYKMTWPFYESYEPGDKRKEKIIGEYTGTNGVKHSKLLDRDSGTKGLLYLGAVPVKYGFEGVIGDMSETDMPIFRFADVITLLSEAIVRNGNVVTQEAVDYLNQVRTRAGLAPYNLNDFSNLNDFLDKLLLERGHEFYLEGVRRQDLIRHGKFIEFAIEKAKFYGEPIEKISTIVDGVYKYERFPLPPAIINEGKGIILQNPGF